MGWVRRPPLHATFLALALVAASCSRSIVQVAPGGVTPIPPRSSGPGSSLGAPPRSPGGSAAPPARPAYDDDGPVGAMARAYLQRSPARSLVVEVDWVDRRAPAQTALDHLGDVLHRELDKPAGIRIERGNVMAAPTSSWTIADLMMLERANRAAHSSGEHATLWIGYVNGAFAPNANALAVAFGASAAVIFRDRIDDATTALILEPAIERAVLLHEAGHLLALVNLGYRSKIAHEDAAHPHHSNDPDSVMYWAVEDVSVQNILRGGPPDDFDQADRADLAMLRGR